MNLRLRLSMKSLLGMWLAMYLGVASSCGRFDSGAAQTPPDIPCDRSLRCIGRWLCLYKEKHGTFPPSTLIDANGNKTSWRLVLLRSFPEYLSGPQEVAMAAYKSDQPWNSPENIEWSNAHGGQFHSRFFCQTEAYVEEHGARWIDEQFTSYLMVVRQQDGVEAMPLPESAIVVVECTGCAVSWWKPEDICINTILEADSPFGTGRLNSGHPDFVKAVRADGEVINIPKDITKNDLRDLLDGTHKEADSFLSKRKR